MANEDKKAFNAMLMDSKNMPKVQIITDEKSIEKYGGDKMYFAPPIDYDKVISQKVLTDSLRQMMSDGLAYRHDYHEQPPRVEYGLTELGTKMLPIVNSLADFGNYYKSIIEQN